MASTSSEDFSDWEFELESESSIKYKVRGLKRDRSVLSRTDLDSELEPETSTVSVTVSTPGK